MSREIKCSQCGKVFEAKGSRAKCCSESCRRKVREAYNKKYRETHREELAARRRKYYETHREERRAYNIKKHEDNKEEDNARSRKHYETHKEEHAAHRRKWYETHREECNAGSKKWRETHREELAANKRKYYHEIQKLDPLYILNKRMSYGIRDSLKGNKNGSPWESLVPYTLEDVQKSFEKLFKPGMTWENFGKWHIDHKIPVWAFNFSSPYDIDFQRCWALENLQPMWAEDNLKKSNKLEQAFQPSLAFGIAI